MSHHPLVRRLGRLVETVHAVTYFSAEPQAAYLALGLKGYWRGYFAGRAAVLGAATAQEVQRAFGVFAPAMVERAIPGVWSIAAPADAEAARLHGATAALQRVLAGFDVTDAVTALRPIVELAPVADSPLAAAIAKRPVPPEPIGELWRHCTLLREHRGTGHLAAVADRGMGWPQPDVVRQFAGTGEPRQQQYRGWTDEEWSQAETACRNRGLADRAAAREFLDRLEDDTDRGAVISGVSLDQLERACETLTPLAVAVVQELPFPNAMGLPKVGFVSQP